MLQRLRGVPGVAQLAEEALPGALVLADAGDLSLAAMCHAAGKGGSGWAGTGGGPGGGRDAPAGGDAPRHLPGAAARLLPRRGADRRDRADRSDHHVPRRAAGSRLSTRFTVRGIVRTGLTTTVIAVLILIATIDPELKDIIADPDPALLSGGGFCFASQPGDGVASTGGTAGEVSRLRLRCHRYHSRRRHPPARRLRR